MTVREVFIPWFTLQITAMTRTEPKSGAGSQVHVGARSAMWVQGTKVLSHSWLLSQAISREHDRNVTAAAQIPDMRCQHYRLKLSLTTPQHQPVLFKFNFIYLKEKQTQSSYLLVYSSNVSNSWDWARLKLGAQN